MCERKKKTKRFLLSPIWKETDWMPRTREKLHRTFTWQSHIIDSINLSTGGNGDTLLIEPLMASVYVECK